MHNQNARSFSYRKLWML